ncbi:DUF2059 domain-containing protein [Sphingomonas sp. LB-2]|uniref:DUF2059 domain-containing protein n=1 Tax=Sphingomonas caeni TaxID=2984949 RepID=UPI00222FD3D7|nr:DUF2059 domain-containing protein [Sphingomonas caeni]MCW3846941.1 DUF2059 domain-containing protein [Sphingomonas caeni]
MKFLFAALALTAPLTMTPPAAATVAPVPAPTDDLDRLVGLMIPDRAMLDLVFAGLNQGLDQEVGGAEFARYPGMRDYMVAQIRPELSRAVLAGLPALRADIRKILAGELTPQEAGELYRFFASPTGQKVYAITLQSMGENIAKGEEAMQRAAFDKVMASLTPEDYGPLAEFGQSSGAQKMQRISPQINAVSTAWADRLVAEIGPGIRTIALKAVTDYKRQHSAGGQ